MYLDLSEIAHRQGMTVRQKVDQPRVEDPDLEFSVPIQGELTFSNSGETIHLHGQIASTVVMPCARCLADVAVPVHEQVEEHLPITDVLNPNRPVDPDEDPEIVMSTIVHLDQGRPILDLDELIRQWIVCGLPLRTLCSEECAGLCSTCGVNLNDGRCRCEAQQASSPFAALASLLETDPNRPAD